MAVFGFPDVPDDIDDNSANRMARAHRNKLLTESDFSQMADVPMTDDKRAEWRTYRQLLRDLPEDPNWPNPVEPQPPTGDN
jgi:hypothetical protein